MNDTYIQDKTFDAKDRFTKADYDNCIFNNCNFYEFNLSGFIFIDCEFNGCNLSLAKLEKTAFRDVKFKDCKMLGLRFDLCAEFGVSFSFDNCQLDHSSFHQTKIKKTVFKKTKLHEVDFSGCDLTGAIFDNCDLTRAVFENTIIEKADLRTAYNYSIDLEVNKVKGAKFALAGVAGLLEKYDIEIEGK